MTLASMTGFASVDGQFENHNWVWEVRAVNGRGLDVRFRLPSSLAALEDHLRKTVRGAFKRGNLQISLQFDRGAQEDATISVNLDQARNILQQLKPLVDEGLVAPPSADGLLGVRGMLEINARPLALDKLRQPVTDSFGELLAALREARLAEGLATGDVLNETLDKIEHLVEQARDNPSLKSSTVMARLQAQIAELGQTIEPERLAQEVALLVIKADIAEELDRLSGHIVAARTLLNASEPVGRKLEFLAQEFNREANTLCAKSNDQQLTQIGLELKTLIDQIKEQAANVE